MRILPILAKVIRAYWLLDLYGLIFSRGEMTVENMYL